MSFLNRLQAALTNPFYIKQRRLVQNWIETTSGIQHLQLKNASFYITASEKQDKLAHFLDDIDQIIESGLMVKKSHTRASIFSIDKQLYFGKAEKLSQSVWYKQIRYYFSPARSLWSAVVAERMSNEGIITPKVLAAGESRNKGRLLTSYLITEAESESCGLNHKLSSIESQTDLLELFLKISKSIRTMHDAGIAHEDLVPSNLYVSNNSVGFWDLDSCILFDHPLNTSYRENAYKMFANAAKNSLHHNEQIRLNSNLWDNLVNILVNPLSEIDVDTYKRTKSSLAFC